MWIIKPNFVTIIIPTKGRATLKKSIQSLIDQTDWNWRCIIIFDGINPIEITGLNPDINYLKDNHFIVHSIDKIGHAGLVRNFALPLVDTVWTAFLDDDDYLLPTYVERLRMYNNIYSDKNIIIFTYRDVENRNIQPPLWMKEIKSCNVGISFAIKTEFIQKNNIIFPPGGVEDFAFLDSAVKAGGKYIIPGDIQYMVGHRSAWN